MISRRNMILSTAALAAAGGAALNAQAQVASTRPATSTIPPDSPPLPPGEPGVHYTPVVVPNGVTLPYRLVDGVKVFHLIAEELEHEFAPGLRCKVWGYNGRTPGPVIEAVEGDRVRIFVTNRLPEPTTVHWHGVLLPAGMDGVSAISQPPIPPGETFRYEFTLRQHGTQMYHPHTDEMVQIAMGMVGMFIIHPRTPDEAVSPKVDRDFALMLHEWRIDAGASRPDPLEMTDFNVLTFNSKAFPGTDPLVVKRGDRVRIRLGNLGPMDHHPIHLHGYQFHVTGTDGGTIPPSARVPMTTVLVPVGTTQTIEFVADAPGDWVMHCHMTHHMMNQMGHGFTNTLGMNTQGIDQRLGKLLPGYMTMGQHGMADMGAMGMPMPDNSIPMKGAEMQFGYTDMGGMFTILKVRDELASYDADPGFYRHPAGTVAGPATAEEIRMLGEPIPRRQPSTAQAGEQPLYTCPMHEEVVQRGPGKCPRCKMALEVKK